MATHDEDALFRLVESVVDGKPVDWDEHVFTDPAMQQRVERLRVLAHIAGMVSPLSHDPGRTGDPAPETWGPLRILEKLSEGTSAEVYRALDPALERQVALKLQRPGPGLSDTAFLDEARRLARIRHPNVVFVHGVDRHDGRAGLWTDLLPGKTLEACLLEQGPFAAREAALIGIDVCRALAAVHAAGLVHRDVKTANIMREEGGRIVLTDFGVTADRRTGDGAGPGTVAGSPLYMAPEIFEGNPSSPVTDVYSLGVVLFRLVTGRYPFTAGSLEDLTGQLRRGDTPHLLDIRPDLPEPFIRVVERALALDPEQRYQTAGDMEAALSRLVGSGGRASRGKRLGLAGGLAAVFVVLGFFLWPRIAPGRYTVEAALYRKGQAEDERLLPETRIRPGDRLYLEVEASDDLNFYVLDEDEKGHAFLLFPVAGVEPENPLRGGERHRLPGVRNGSPQTWQVDTAGGKETLLLIASRRPLDEEDGLLSGFRAPHAAPFDATVPDNAAGGTVSRRLRGIGRLADEERGPGHSAENRLAGVMQELGVGKETAHGLWVREIQLDNPESGNPEGQ